ncbi:MAG: tripartite tricarboxylate transporter TctB family protein [Spirochaetes bacterium]|nr:tripartite tricarboxylate transporter TctB family protein [Spirochaetota bacterium]MBU1079424.1 tripartite tricarboxylate transporter TctB family protein [Spirochaetota bacterium]
MDRKRSPAPFGVNQVIPIAAAAMAGVFIWLGLGRYGFWHEDKGPLPGFFPVVIATAMLIFSAFAFFASFKEAAPSWPRANWYVVLSVALIIGATFLLGLIPSIAIYLLVWLRLYERCSWRATLVTFGVVMAIVVGCFVLWLGVPFPKGIIFELIFR